MTTQKAPHLPLQNPNTPTGEYQELINRLAGYVEHAALSHNAHEEVYWRNALWEEQRSFKAFMAARKAKLVNANNPS